MRPINADELAPLVKRLIEMMPTVDPVKHGHWEDENIDDQVIARCSVCNTWDTTRTPYCPHCGAYMMGEVQDDEAD